MNEKHKLLELVKAIKKEPSNDKKWEILIKWLDIFMTKLQGGQNQVIKKQVVRDPFGISPAKWFEII